MNLVARDAEVRQLGLPAARRSTSGPRRSRRRRYDMGITSQAQRLPGREPRRPDATASRRWRWPTPTRRSPPAAGATGRSRSRRSRFPDGKVDNLGKPRRTRRSPTASTPRRRRSSSRTSRAAPARARRSAARPPARPARPTTTPTRGSSATRRSLSTVGLGRLSRTRASMNPPTTPTRRRRHVPGADLGRST